MKTSIVEFHCSQCGTKFRAAVVSDFAYGIMLCRTPGGEVRYVDCFEDPVFGEIVRMIDALRIEPLDDARASAAQREAFGLSCDPSLNGERFHAGVAPLCPQCGTARGERGQEPVDFVNLDAVTHDRWGAMSDAQRRELVREALRF